MELLAAELTDYLFFIAIRDEYIRYQFTSIISVAEQSAKDHLQYAVMYDVGRSNIPSAESAAKIIDKIPRYKMLVSRIIDLCRLRHHSKPTSINYFKPIIDNATATIRFNIVGTNYSIPLNKSIYKKLHSELHNHRMLPWFTLFVTLRTMMSPRHKLEKSPHYYSLCGAFFDNNPDILHFIEHYGSKKRIMHVDVSLDPISDP